MRRAIVGKWMGISSFLFFVFAFATLFSSSAVYAAEDMSFRTMEFDFYRQGQQDSVLAGRMRSATAILAATDTDSDFYGGDRGHIKGDGKLISNTGIGNFLVNGSRTIKTGSGNSLMSRPVIANIQTGDPLILVALIEDVTASVVSGLQTGSISPTNNDIINQVTADFSAELFSGSTSPSIYAGVHPTYVTGVGFSAASYGLAKVNNDATTVVVIWEVPSLVVAATDAAISRLSLSATLGINLGGKASHIARSNLVGVETNSSGPQLVATQWANSLAITGVTDTVTKVMFEGVAPADAFAGVTTHYAIPVAHVGTDGSPRVPTNTALARNVRGEDLLHMKFHVDPRADFDGEPDEYFGASSDPLVLSATGSGLLEGSKSYGSVAYVRSTLTSNDTAVFTADAALPAAAKEIIPINSSSRNDGKRIFNFNEISAGAGIVHVSAQIAANVVTSGSFSTFLSELYIADDVRNVTFGYTVGAVDTSALFISDLTMRDELGVEFGEIGGATDYYDEAVVAFDILTGGERPDLYQNWLNISVDPRLGAGGTFTSAGGLITFRAPDADYPGVILSASEGPATVKNIPSGNVNGVSAIMRINNDLIVSDRTAYVIASVSDDARNPAKIYVSDSDGGYGSRNTTAAGATVVNATLDSRRYDSYSKTSTDPLIALKIDNSTVSIDNLSPVVLDATLSVLRMPVSYWNDTTNTSDTATTRFNLIRNATEVKEAPVNFEVANGIYNVTKGTVASGVNLPGIKNAQNGSPVRLVIRFRPTIEASKALDVDHLLTGATGLSDAAFKTYFQQKFKVEIVSPQLVGWSTGGAGVLPSGWTLDSVTIHTTVGADNVGWATYINETGLPKITRQAIENTLTSDQLKTAIGQLNPNGIALSVTGVSVFITIADNTINYPDSSGANVKSSNTLIVDASKPSVNLIPLPIASDGVMDATLFAGGLGRPASTVLLITNTANADLATIRTRTGFDEDVDSVALLGLTRNATGFINNAPYAVNNAADLVKQTVAPEVQAGYMIIISATFEEEDHADSEFGPQHFTTWKGGTAGTVTESTAFFPYLITLGDATATHVINAASTTYGREFKTIAADFSDFITNAKDVLPDASSVIGGGSVSKPGSESIIAATWFYLIRSEDPLNTSIASNSIRYVTLTTRDLSGNVSAVGIPVATGSFVKPTPEIWVYQIYGRKRAEHLDGAVVQRSSSHPLGTSSAAFTISAATTNINDTTLLIVTRVTNAHLTTTNPIQADLSQFGLGTINPVASNAVSANGQVITIANATAGSVAWATFETNKLTASTFGAGKKAIIYATGVTFGVGNVEAAPISADRQAPTTVVGKFTTGNVRSAAGTLGFRELPHISGDTLDDGLARPGQQLQIEGGVKLDAQDQANISSLTVKADLSKFGITELRNASVTKQAVATVGDAAEFPSLIAGDPVLWATWTFSVPGTPPNLTANAVLWATDAAANDSSVQNLNIQIDATKPSVVSNVLSASVAINLVTDTFGTQFVGGSIPTDYPWFIVGKRPTPATIYSPTAIVKQGDKVRVEAIFNVNDSVFTSLTTTANFSDISGNSSVSPITTKAQAGLYYATWEEVVAGDTVVKTKDNAVVTITATDPAGEAVSNDERVSVPIIVDVSKPEVTTVVKYFKNNVAISGTVNPRDLNAAWTGQNGWATASIVVDATYTDAGITKGYAGSVLVSLARKAGLNLDTQHLLTSSVNPAVLGGWLSINGENFTPVGIADSKIMLPSLWVIIGDGPTVWGGDFSYRAPDGTAGFVSRASTANQVRQSTNTHVIAYYGTNPYETITNEQSGYRIKTDIGVASAKFVARVTDSIGNMGSVNSTAIKVDGQSPEFPAAKTVAGATLDISSARTLQPYVDYIPAFYSASGLILRPTRVGIGSWLQTELYIKERPTWNDKVLVEIDTTDNLGNNNQFAGQNFSVLPINNVSPTNALTKGNRFQFEVVPAINPQPVTVEFQMSTNRDNLDGSWPITANNTGNNDRTYNWGYGYVQNSLVSGSAVLLYATDERKNDTQSANLRSSRLEIDKDGPYIAKDNFVSQTTLEGVNALNENSAILNGNQVNFLPSSWLVYAATFVVDGTEDVHFRNFNLDWSGAFETDTNRFVRSGGSLVNYWGRKFVVESCTRSIIFVTNAVQIDSNASPSTQKRVWMYVYDAFGNETKKEGRDIAINARGPRAVEVTLTVNGISEVTAGSASNLGIGNRSDTSSAQFEFAMGDRLVVDALVTTINGEAPDTIFMDASDLYPPKLNVLTNELIPSATELSAQGTIHARWDTIAYDYTGTVVGQAAGLAGVARDASRWFADQSVLRTLVNNNAPVPGHPLPGIATQGNYAGDVVFNGPIVGITPATYVDVQPAQLSGAQGWNQASVAQSISTLQGLPYIQVQNGAAAKRVAWVTVFVYDNDSLFPAEQTLSALFTVDASPPLVSFEIPAADIVRKYAAMTTEFVTIPGSARIGYPSAPNIAGIATIPNRVREGDTVKVIVDVTNQLINGAGNDDFRGLPGLSRSSSNMFDIDVNSTVLNVTADFKDLNPSLDNVFAVQGQTGIIPTTLDVTHRTELPSLIRATYQVPIANSVGVTSTTSRDPRSVTPTVMDDAGNVPHNNVFDNRIKRQITPNLAVDNAPPSISGSLDVVIQRLPEGSAFGAVSPAGAPLGEGAVVPGGSSIVAGTVLRITATVTDQVDSPIDVLRNPNYGFVSMDASGINLNVVPRATDLAVSDVVLDISRAQLSGPDSVAIPFLVQIPSTEGGISTPSFRFIVNATDTVGNMDSKQSNASFSYDAKPTVTVTYNNAVLDTEAKRTLTLDAGGTYTLSAAGFDVGGVTSIRWIVPGSAVTTTVFSTSPATENLIREDLFNPQRLNLDLLIQPNIDPAGPFVFAATAGVIDTLNNEVFSGQHILNINQPALFAAEFVAVETNSAGVVVEGVTQFLTAMLDTETTLHPADADVREVTIPEGSTLVVDVVASDANGDPITMAASGSALTATNIQSSAFEPVSNGLYRYTFVPGYQAVTGLVESTSFELDVTATDGKHAGMDNVCLLVNVTAQPATPTVNIVSVSVADVVQPGVGNAGNVNVKELQKLQVVVHGADAGLDDVTIDVSAPASVLSSPDYSVASVSANGVVDATITFTPDVNFSDLPSLNNPDDPFVFTFTVTNVPDVGTPVAGSTTLNVDVINESQPPQITTTVSVNVGAAATIANNGIVNIAGSNTVVFKFKAADPDGDSVLFPTVTLLNADDYTYSYTVTNIQATFAEAQLTMNAPASVAPENVTATVIFSATDTSTPPKSDFATYYVVMTTVTPPVVVDIDEIVFAAGQGGQTSVNVRNFDPNGAVPINGNLRGFRGEPIAFAEKIGGGLNRASFVSVGDLDMDGQLDIVTTLGPVIEAATLPNIVIPRDGVTKIGVSHPFNAFPFDYTGEDTRPVVHNYGGLRTAIGNFIGSSVNQIAVAQGIGGKQIIRLWQYTGLPAPNGYKLVGQIQGLLGAEWAANANGAINIAAADLDNDGVDELLVAQSYSATSNTTFNIVNFVQIGDAGVAANTIAGEASRVASLRGFHNDRFRGNGGIDIDVADVNGDGNFEFVVASTGDTKKLAGDNFINLIGVVVPVITDGVVTGVEYKNGYVMNIFDPETNPSGAMRLTTGEFDGDLTNGDELALTTGAILEVDGFDVTTVLPAPVNKYIIIKVAYNGTAFTGWSRAVQGGVPITPSQGVQVFAGAFAPPSGALDLAAGNIDKLQIGN